MLFSCQRMELPEDSTILNQGEGVRGEVKITFSAQIPMPVQTKAMGEEPFMTDAAGSLVKGDLQTMHLVVFDENGMLVETQEAKIITPVDGTHNTGRYDKEEPVILPEAQFEVTLTVSDQPRIIHFIANCPVNQITYGHESSIIGNMYVTKANSDEDPKTTYETAYWGRVEFPYILVEKKTDANGNVVTDEDGNIAYIPHNSIISKFQCIPMVRNFAQIVVRNNAENFNLEAFAIYNTIDKGTVAPYNSNSQKFQSFTFGVTNNQKYSYPQLTYPHLGFLTEPYEGHALASAQLNTDLHGFYASKWVSEVVRDENGDIIRDEDGNPMTEQIQECAPYYMYERKVSARTDQEELWNESPPHLIIKGSYNNGASSYYKADLIYSREQNGMTSNHYYNILRNFRYQFTVVRVSGDGYPTPEEAIQGAPSNNLSISTTTTKFTNISDEYGRLFVSYTDTTLVNNNTIKLKYKYIPDFNDLDANGDPKINNNFITTENEVGVKFDGFDDGAVITDYEVAESDITEGTWAGYREITLTISDPSAVNKNQTVTIRTNNTSLSRDVRYTLKNPYRLQAECTEKVAAQMNTPVEVDVKLPIGLTQDMFPLELAIEVYDMTLSPDATKNTKQLPVKTGPSIIPAKNGVNTFHYVLTINTYEEYQAITANADNYKVIKTYWVTNKADNESTVYVVNKYFETATDSFINAKSFSGLTITPSTIAFGVGRSVSISFTMDSKDDAYSGRTVNIKLNGLANSTGETEFTVTPTQRTVTITGLVTTTAEDNVSFTVSEPDYATATSAEASRRRGTFTPVNFTQGNQTVTTIATTENQDVTLNFTLSDYQDGMTVNVSLDGLLPADGTLTEASTRAAVSYVYTPSAAGKQTIRLKTTSGAKTCSAALSAYGFDDASAELEQSDRKTGTIARNRTIQGTLSNVPNNTKAQNNCTATISIDGNDDFTATCNVQKQNNTFTYTITITSSKTVTYAEGQEANISLEFRNNSNNYYYGTCSVADLIAGNVRNIVLTRE